MAETERWRDVHQSRRMSVLLQEKALSDDGVKAEEKEELDEERLGRRSMKQRLVVTPSGCHSRLRLPSGIPAGEME